MVAYSTAEPQPKQLKFEARNPKQIRNSNDQNVICQVFKLLLATSADREAIAAAATAARLSRRHCVGIAREELRVAEAVGGGPRYDALREFFNVVADLRGKPASAAERSDPVS